MLRAVADFIKTAFDFGRRILLQRDAGEADYRVHRCTDIVGHIVEEGAFRFIGSLRGDHCFLRRKAQSVKLLIVLLLKLDHLTASLQFHHAPKCHQHQQRHGGYEDSPRADGGVHHIHGADCNALGRDQKHQRHVIVFQRRKAIVILGLIQQDIRRRNAVPVQLFFDHVKAPPLNILRFFQRLVYIPRADDIIVVRVKIG